ncbi:MULTISPECIES: SCP2 sterol-binding domain-containing protein [unclassified Frankia]
MSDLAVDPTADPAKLVSGLPAMSEREVSDLLGGPAGDAVLDEVFRQMRDTFRPEQAQEENALVRFVLNGGPGGAVRTYELRVADGVCTLATPPAAGTPSESAGEQTLTIVTDRVRFVRVVSGQASGAKLFLTRKIKINGDLKFGGRILSWFEIKKEN